MYVSVLVRAHCFPFFPPPPLFGGDFLLLVSKLKVLNKLNLSSNINFKSISKYFIYTHICTQIVTLRYGPKLDEKKSV